ncbi:MAG TPA: hypothetical protein VM425_20755 [Myxococcota bacterium]|nr:hypothetical protein [Myxococcota bacterium]
MNKIDSQIARLLRAKGLLDQFQHQSVLDHLGRRGGRFHSAVLELGYVSEARMAAILSKVTGFSSVSLAKMKPDLDALQRLSGEFCSSRCVYPCAVRDAGKTLWLAMADPTDIDVCNAARAESGLEIRPLVGNPSDIKKHVQARYADQIKEESPFVVGAIDLSLSDDEEAEQEFKITDLAGKTTVKHTKDIKPQFAPVAADQASNSPEQLQRLDKLLEYQHKAERIIRSVVRLMVDKGLFSADEFRKRLK